MAKKIPDSIYCKLLKLTRQKEDFFTESLAFALQKDRIFLNNFMHLIIDDKIGNIDDLTLDVRTQVAMPFGRLDMVITINEKINVAVENKLWSIEGEGQLKKYINNQEIDYLAFITAEIGYKIDPKVLDSNKYLKPQYSDHFTWESIFPVIDNVYNNASVHFYISELHHLFMYLGFGTTALVNQATQLIPITKTENKVDINDLAIYDRKFSENIFTLQTNYQGRFQKIYQDNIELLESFLLRYKWGSAGKKVKEIGNKHGQIYAYHIDLTNDTQYLRLYITPTREGNAIRIRFSMSYKSDFVTFVDNLETNLENYELLYELIPDLKKNEQVEVVIPLTEMPNDDSQAMDYLFYLFEIVFISANNAIKQINMRLNSHTE